MKGNLHKIERLLRVAIGLLISSFAVIGPQDPWFLFGLIFVVTGAIGFCPLYRFAHFSTVDEETSVKSDVEKKSSAPRAA